MMCSRIAIAAFAVGMSLATTGIVLSPPTPATAQSAPTPTISRVDIGSRSPGVVDGTSAPGAHVVLRANGRLLGHSVADAKGNWRISLTRALDAGDYRLTVTSRVLGVDQEQSGEDVRVAVPADGGPARAVLPRVAGTGASDETQLRRAGELADAATKRFDELMPKAQPATQPEPRQPEQRMAQAPTPTQAPTRNDPPIDRMRVAQATKTQGATPAPRAAEEDFFSPVWDWLERAHRQYQGVIVKQLSEGGPADSLAMPAPTTAPRTPASPPAPAVATPKAPAPATTPSTVVGQAPTAPAVTPPAQPKVAQAPTPSTTPPVPSTPPVAKAPAPAPAPVEKDVFDQVQETFSDWLDRANRQYQSVIVRRLSDPNPNPSDTAMPTGKSLPPVTPPVAVAQQPTPPAPPVAQPKAVEDAARLVEQQKREAELKAKAETDRRTAEAKAKADADAKTRLDEDRRVAEAKTKAEAEVKAKAEADARVAAAAKAKADTDAKTRSDEDRRVAEAKTKAEAEVKAKAEADARVAAAAKAKGDEDRRLAAAKAKAEEDARVAAAAKAKADEEVRVAAAAKTKADDERRVAEARAKSDSENRVAAAAAAAAAATASKAEVDRRAAAARAEEQTKRVADAAAAIALAERRAADAVKQAQARVEGERRAADAAKKAVADAAEKTKTAETPAPITRSASPTRITVQRTVRPGTRLATSGRTGRRVASLDSRSGLGATRSTLKYAKSSRSTCARLAGQPVKQGRWYVVKRGDTLWSVAQMHYGDGRKFRLLLNANKQRVIYPCQRIEIPRA